MRTSSRPSRSRTAASHVKARRVGGKLVFATLTVCVGLLLVPTGSEATDANCPQPPFGAGAWPGACYKPFETRSVFAQKLPSRSSLLRHSTPAVASPVSARPGNLAVNTRGAGPGEPIYYSKPMDPLFTLSCVQDPYARSDHSCPVDTLRTGIKLRIPAGARPEGNHSTVVGSGPAYDAHLIVIDSASGWVYDFWQVHSNSSWQQVQQDGTVVQGLTQAGGVLEFGWGSRIRINGDGTAAHQPRTDAIDDTNAAHWAESAARVRAEELTAGSIQHALWLNISCTANTLSVYPADVGGRGTPARTLSLHIRGPPARHALLARHDAPADLRDPGPSLEEDHPQRLCHLRRFRRRHQRGSEQVVLHRNRSRQPILLSQQRGRSHVPRPLVDVRTEQLLGALPTPQRRSGRTGGQALRSSR